MPNLGQFLWCAELLEGDFRPPRRGRPEAALHPVSFPGGIASHVAPETPGSIHEGGELGYALSHAYGAAFDNPDLIVACVVGYGEAETGPLATGWHGNKFLNPVRDGCVLPICTSMATSSPTPRYSPAVTMTSWKP
jgi:hypothetical protein